MTNVDKRIWDGRGEALGDARLSTADGRMADDLRLKASHFRVMAHVGRQNHRRGWLRVSQSELAERWQCHRNSINRAFNDLVAWGYLMQRTQHEAGESFCLYKVVLDGECDDGAPPAKSPVKPPIKTSAKPQGECTPECAPPAGGGAHHNVHMCTLEEYTRAHWGSTPPTIYPRAHRLSPTDEEKTLPPPPRGETGSGEGGEERNSGLQTRGWAKGWDEAARNAVYDLLQTDRRHVAMALLLPLVGTLNPPAGVHGASFVRDLAEQVGGWPEAVLQRLGETVRAERVRDLPAASKLRQTARAVATLMAARDQQAAADAADQAARPSTQAWLAALTAGNPQDPCNALCRRLVGRLGVDVARSWFAEATVERRQAASGGSRVVVTLPNKFQARYVEGCMSEDVRRAARAEWRDVIDVEIVARSAAA